MHNAETMGIDLSTIDCIVISHGHHDHTGGLPEVLRLKGEVDVIAHPDIFSAKYAKYGERPPRYCGIPHLRDELESMGARFELSREPVRIADNIFTTGEVPLVSAYEAVDDGLVLKEGTEFKSDPLADDLALVIDTDFGLVVILGCAHRGIVNTLKRAQQISGKEQIYAVVGGTHLFRAGDERLENTVSELKEMGITRLGVSHCTGFYPSARLAREFGDLFFLNNAGTKLILP